MDYPKTEVDKGNITLQKIIHRIQVARATRRFYTIMRRDYNYRISLQDYENKKIQYLAVQGFMDG